MRHTYLRIAVAGVFLVALSVGSFYLTRELREGSDVTAEGPPLDPSAIRAAVAADAALERFDGTIAGIRLSPDLDVANATTLCVGTDDIQWFDIDAPEAAGLPVVPSDLPPSAEFLGGVAVVCRGELASVEAEWFVPPDPVSGFRGGHVHVYRFKGEPRFRGDYPGSRVKSSTVSGRPAIEVVPVTPGGVGDAALLIREPWGLTTIRTSGFTSAQVHEFGNSLLGEGPQ